MDVCTHCVSHMPGPLPILLGLVCLAVLAAVAVADNFTSGGTGKR